MSIKRSAIIAGLHEVSIEPARRMRGKGFKWDHEIQIALPASYGKTNRAYPVLWLTDGQMYFEQAVKAVNFDLRRHVPEMIVVAVGTAAEELDQFVHRRGYDFSPPAGWAFSGPGADLLNRELASVYEQQKAAGGPAPEFGGATSFLDFLVDEVRPALARDYRMADDHTLFGDSGGGFFCAYALFARPEGFTRYVCGSPNLYGSDLEIFRMEEQRAKTQGDLKAIVFFGAGEAEAVEKNIIPAWGIVSSTARIVEILSMRRYPSLKLSARIFPGEDHASVVSSNLSWGLRAVWEGTQGFG